MVRSPSAEDSRSLPISPRPVILVILKDGVGPWVLICLFVCKSGFCEDEDWCGGEKKNELKALHVNNRFMKIELS